MTFSAEYSEYSLLELLEYTPMQHAAGVGGKRAAEGREAEDDARARVRRRTSGGTATGTP